MSMEEQIRKIHTFQGQVNDFIKKTAPLTQKELEILLAKLSDLIETEPAPDSVLDKKFKGLLARQIYEVRLSGNDPSFTERILLHLKSNPECRIYILENYQFAYPFPLREEIIIEWANATPDFWQRLLTSGQ